MIHVILQGLFGFPDAVMDFNSIFKSLGLVGSIRGAHVLTVPSQGLFGYADAVIDVKSIIRQLDSLGNFMNRTQFMPGLKGPGQLAQMVTFLKCRSASLKFTNADDVPEMIKQEISRAINAVSNELFSPEMAQMLSGDPFECSECFVCFCNSEVRLFRLLATDALR